MTTTIRVLLIEDSRGYARLIREMLSEAKETRFVLDHAVRLSDGLALLAEGRSDIVLLDLGLPDSQGLETLRSVQEQAPGVPVVVLTGLDDEETAFRAVRMDAQDYLFKGQIDSNLLVRSIRYAMERKRTREALRKSEEQYRELVQNANSIILKLDNKGTITFFNEFAQEFFGYAGDEIIGRNVLGTIVPHTETTGRDLAAMVRDIFSNPEGYLKNENENVRKNGERVWISWTNRPVRDESGNLAGILAVGLDITERRQMEEIIRQQASYDFLTGLPNRMLFMDHLGLEMSQARRNGRKLAVLFLDLDRFKNINDALGHAAGDQLLKDVAARLKACVRESDTVARIGGDEFNLLLSDIDHVEDTAVVLRKITGTLTEPFTINGHMLHVTSSTGISIFPDDSENAETLIKNADIAMYHVKEQGRNGYQFYNHDINTRTVERMVFENSLRRTIERGELTVYYQPQVDIATRRMVCAEALVRWRHPEQGLLSPGQFIPLAEETGLIIPIGEWVLHSACAQTRAWQEAGYQPMCITVNLSARQFMHPELSAVIEQVLRETNLGSEWLELEITESTAMQDVGHTVFNLSRLTGMGIRFSIDDFGTGCTSLSYLKSLPIQKLKIDRSFIRGITEDPSDKAIVNAVIALAHNLNLKVVAEGVETEAQLSFLRSSKCDEVQGFLVSEPLPNEEFESLMAK